MLPVPKDSVMANYFDEITPDEARAFFEASLNNRVERTYNTFVQLANEYQEPFGAVDTVHTRRCQYAYADGSANTIRSASMTYPDGRVINHDYGSAGSMADAASRVAGLLHNGVTHLADYSYLGLGTIVEVDETQPDLRFTLVGTAGGNDPDTGDIYRGVDRFGRVKDLLWRDYGAGSDAARIRHGYDRVGNRLWREDPLATSAGKGFDELYGYDGSDRVKGLSRGTLNSLKTQVSSLTFSQCWTLDATGNWKGFRQDDTGDGTWDLVQSRTANPVNEITNITNSTGSAWAAPGYNGAGNMTSVPQPGSPGSAYGAVYDAWNRLVKLTDGANTVQENTYDPLGRRLVKKKYTVGGPTETRRVYYSSAWQPVEERVGLATAPERQFVWGLRYIDDLILRDRDPNGDGVLDERMYPLQDPNWNVIGLTDVNGDVQERYAYDAYGLASVLTPTFTSRASSSYDWETRYAGYRWDGETGLYAVRHRMYHPRLGTWLQRDPVGYYTSQSLYDYVRSMPLRLWDPFGLQACGHHHVTVQAIAKFESFLSEGARDYGLGSYSGPTQPSHAGQTLEGVTHQEYNALVEKEMEDFIKAKKISEKKKMTPKQMKEFIDTKIKGAPKDSRIGKFNQKIDANRAAYLEENTKCSGPRPGVPESTKKTIERGKTWRKTQAPTRWKNARLSAKLRGMRFKGAGKVVGAVGLGAGAISALESAVEKPNFKDAIEALDRDDVDKAHRLMTSETTHSVYGDLLDERQGEAAAAFKQHVDKEFSDAARDSHSPND
jgi:RHS repeat-associated protein